MLARYTSISIWWMEHLIKNISFISGSPFIFCIRGANFEIKSFDLFQVHEVYYTIEFHNLKSVLWVGTVSTYMYQFIKLYNNLLHVIYIFSDHCICRIIQKYKSDSFFSVCFDYWWRYSVWLHFYITHIKFVSPLVLKLPIIFTFLFS